MVRLAGIAEQGRRFTFFDKAVVKDPATGKDFDGFHGLNITCSTSGRGLMLLGDHEGTVHMVDREFRVNGFDAFSVSVTHLIQLKANNVLIGIGSDEEG
jgi:hypothetical protein